MEFPSAAMAEPDAAKIRGRRGRTPGSQRNSESETCLELPRKTSLENLKEMRL